MPDVSRLRMSVARFRNAARRYRVKNRVGSRWLSEKRRTGTNGDYPTSYRAECARRSVPMLRRGRAVAFADDLCSLVCAPHIDRRMHARMPQRAQRYEMPTIDHFSIVHVVRARDVNFREQPLIRTSRPRLYLSQGRNPIARSFR